MSEYDYLVQEQWSVEDQMYSAQRRTAELQEQIDRLKAARDVIRTEKKFCRAAVAEVDVLRASWYQWNGQRYDEFSDDSSALSQEGWAYHSSIDAVLDEINWKITELENMKLDTENIVGWCFARLNELATLIYNAIN